jgi:hypothetical protein
VSIGASMVGRGDGIALGEIEYEECRSETSEGACPSENDASLPIGEIRGRSVDEPCEKCRD